MKLIREYDITIFNLKEKTHYFDFKVGNSFFELFEGSFIEKGNLITKISLEKNLRHIQMIFSIDGKVELVCDRSLDKFDHTLSIKENIIFKYAEVYEEIDENIIHIPFDCQKINVSQYIYDMISLSIPMKKLHPKYSDDENELTVYTTTQEEKDQTDEESFDPRWKELKKLIDKNK